MKELGTVLGLGVRRWFEGLACVTVAHGWLPPDRAAAAPLLDEPPAGHPERLVAGDAGWHREWVR
ncbi:MULTISPECIES: DUF6059 family protein [Actinomadura]|uniref:DUF6059 family protein n=1 Tax=Actinomadura TaxID=1988 RepID=UPI0004108569|nr:MULTISPECIES: DUF6059 family protein [Actinomadura]